MTDIHSIQGDFPILADNITGKPLVYLDSTATALKPRQVVNAMRQYEERYTANVFRGIYRLSEYATEKYEEARRIIADFIGASENEVIFTRNTTESLNLVAYALEASYLTPGDEMITTIMEHHSNFVPWQQRGANRGYIVRILSVDQEGNVKPEELKKFITRKTKLFTITATSNVLGTIVNIQTLVSIVKSRSPTCLILIDAAQAVPHMPVDVAKWGADFIAFSGHKMLGPTGIGVLWAKKSILETLPPFLYGGDMIREVHRDRTVFNDIPHRFEAGTPNISGAIGLGAAVSYLSNIGMEYVRKHEESLISYALEAIGKVSGVTVFGPKQSKERAGVLSFRLEGIHPHDIAQILDEDNICIRVGFHCAQPLHEHLGIGPTARASFYIYNTTKDVDLFIKGLEKIKRKLG